MYKGTKLFNPLIRRIIYSVIYLLFMPCGTKLSLYLISGDVAASRSSDQNRDDRVASITWTRGPHDQKIRHVR